MSKTQTDTIRRKERKFLIASINDTVRATRMNIRRFQRRNKITRRERVMVYALHGLVEGCVIVGRMCDKRILP